MGKLIQDILKEHPNYAAFLSGLLLSAALAPIFFVPALIALGLKAYLIRDAHNVKQAFIVAYLFGLGFFLSGLYWISIGVSVYIEEFWWAIPFALLALPAFLALYIGLCGICAFYTSKRRFYILSFASLWIAFEMLRSYLFTGFPWNLIGYSLAFSDILIQFTSIAGIYGLGFLITLSGGILCYYLEAAYKKFSLYLIILVVAWGAVIKFGYDRLHTYPTNFTSLKLRLVQPSIKQTDKWSSEMFWYNLNSHKDLSLNHIAKFHPDIIIWPESAVVVLPSFIGVFNLLKSLAYNTNSFLITGGVTDNSSNANRSSDKLFVSLYAISPKGEFIFDYHKSHLVPFGEYVPFSDILPLAKLTPGSTPYSPGQAGFIVNLDHFNLKIRPLLCYEVIFPEEVRISNQKADLILNATNDAYYGASSGPYQHFYMARMRAVENGLPLVRVANNGISALFDPLGRIVISSKLNDITVLDAHLPATLQNPTEYSENGDKYTYILMSIILALIVITPKRKIS